MTLYRLQDGESLDRALNRFRRKVAQAGIAKDVSRKRYYLKPSEARHAKERAAARRRWRTEHRERRKQEREAKHHPRALWPS